MNLFLKKIIYGISLSLDLVFWEVRIGLYNRLFCIYLNKEEAQLILSPSSNLPGWRRDRRSPYYTSSFVEKCSADKGGSIETCLFFPIINGL